MQQVRELFIKKPYLAWYVSDAAKLDEKSMVEHILNYGDWEDFQLLKKEFGLKRIGKLFNQIKGVRTNLRPETLSYFENYLEKYA